MSYNRYKLQFRSSKWVFIGYISAHKGYRCLHSSGKVYLARDVIVNEHEFLYYSLFQISKSKDSPFSDLVQHGSRGWTIPLTATKQLIHIALVSNNAGGSYTIPSAQPICNHTGSLSDNIDGSTTSPSQSACSPNSIPTSTT